MLILILFGLLQSSLTEGLIFVSNYFISVSSSVASLVLQSRLEGQVIVSFREKIGSLQRHLKNVAIVKRPRLLKNERQGSFQRGRKLINLTLT